MTFLTGHLVKLNSNPMWIVSLRKGDHFIVEPLDDPSLQISIHKDLMPKVFVKVEENYESRSQTTN